MFLLTGIQTSMLVPILRASTQPILFLTLNVLAKGKLHSLTGKLNHAAGLLIVMRPFLEPLWAAFGGPSPDQRPGCVWAQQIRIELEWFHIFFSGKGATI